MAPFTGCCLAAPAGRGAVRPAPAASRSPPTPRALWPRPSPGCSSRSALPPGARALGAVWHADGEVRPWGPVCRGASVLDACVRARAHACVPCAHGHVCRRARAPVLPIHPRGLPARRTLPAARTSVSGPRVPAPPVGTVLVPAVGGSSDPLVLHRPLSPQASALRAPAPRVGHPSFLPCVGSEPLIRLDGSFPAATAESWGPVGAVLGSVSCGARCCTACGVGPGTAGVIY